MVEEEKKQEEKSEDEGTVMRLGVSSMSCPPFLAGCVARRGFFSLCLLWPPPVLRCMYSVPSSPPARIAYLLCPLYLYQGSLGKAGRRIRQAPRQPIHPRPEKDKAT